MGCSSCQQNNHVVPTTQSTTSNCECACGCSEPVCPTPQPCTEITDSKCIIYTDAVIKCGNDTVVTQNASVSTALNQLTTYFCTQINEILNNPPTPAPEYTYEIGQYVASQGGVIFHRYKDGANENYLVVSISNVSPSSFWSNIDTVLIGASAQSTWDGLSNSNAIDGQPGETSSAAQGCLAYSVGAINDWYLPAIDELNLLYNNKFNVDRTLSGNSSIGIIPGTPTQIGTGGYWSSTEIAFSSAAYFNFGNGQSQFFNKSGLFTVRAVRKFSI
jgi:hypothetical protein